MREGGGREGAVRKRQGRGEREGQIGRENFIQGDKRLR